MKKYFILIAAILIMVCLGGIYGFSMFVPPLKADYGLTTAQTQVIFGFTVISFAVSMVFSGRLLQKLNPKIVGVSSALLFSGGYLIASFSRGNFILLILGLGILSGSGIGFGYACSLTIPIKWFPSFKGLITGLSVAGFGGGAILMSQLAKLFLEKDLEVLFIFRIIAISYGVVIFLSAILISYPPPDQAQPEKIAYLSLSRMLKEKILWYLFGIMFTGTFTGLLIIGNLKLLGLSYGASEFYATLAISLFAAGNSSGRIIWGRIIDSKGGRFTIPLALIFLSLSLLLLLTFAGHNILLIIITFLVGLGFSANFVLFATEISNIYGVENLGGLYPFVHLSYGIAGIISPIIGGWLFDINGSYLVSIIIAASISALGAILYLTTSRKIIKPSRTY